MCYIVCFAYYIHCYFLVFPHVRLKEHLNLNLTRCHYENYLHACSKSQL